MEQSAKQWISIRGNDLVMESDHLFESIKQLKANVVCIIGKARLGKSTLMNVFLTYLTGTNQTPFASSSQLEHVTHGILYYHIPEHNILLLDCQGLEYSDSSSDHKLLLFCYSVANILIFNERNIFNNSSLHTLVSLSSFVNRIVVETSQKPALCIRVSDYDFEEDIDTMISITMKKQHDQFNSIREAIHLLFTSITGCKTNYLERKDLIACKKQAYEDVLSNPENGFEICVHTLLKMANSYEPRILDKGFLDKLIDAINGNDKIDYMSLDVYTLISVNRILEFISTIPKTAYEEFSVTGTRQCYETKIRPRIAQIDSIMKSFDERFSCIADCIKLSHRDSLHKQLNDVLDNIYKHQTKQAMCLAEHHIKTCVDQTNQQITKSVKSESKKNYTDGDISCNDQYIPIQRLKTIYNEMIFKIEKEIEYIDYYVRDSMNDYFEEQKSIIFKHIEEHADRLKEYMNHLTTTIVFHSCNEIERFSKRSNVFGSLMYANALAKDILHEVVRNAVSYDWIDTYVPLIPLSDQLTFSNISFQCDLTQKMDDILKLESIDILHMNVEQSNTLYVPIEEIKRMYVETIHYTLKQDELFMSHLKQCTMEQLHQKTNEQNTTSTIRSNMNERIAFIGKCLDAEVVTIYTKYRSISHTFKLEYILRHLNIHVDNNTTYFKEMLPKEILPILSVSSMDKRDCYTLHEICYDTDSSDKVQYATYLIDKLWKKLVSSRPVQ
jgi:Guanylate-binding protein, N-terminal domain